MGNLNRQEAVALAGRGCAVAVGLGFATISIALPAFASEAKPVLGELLSLGGAALVGTAWAAR